MLFILNYHVSVERYTAGCCLITGQNLVGVANEDYTTGCRIIEPFLTFQLQPPSSTAPSIISAGVLQNNITYAGSHALESPSDKMVHVIWHLWIWLRLKAISGAVKIEIIK